jgi:hypothetical protein
LPPSVTFRPERPWRGRLALALVAGSFAALSSGACRQILSDFTPGTPDASLGSPGSDAGTSPCRGADYPGRSAISDAGGNESFVVVLRTLDWGDRTDAGVPSYETVGLNVDGLCTAAKQQGGCKEPTFARREDHGDGRLGIDNAAGRAASTFHGQITATDQANEDLGIRAYVVRVSGYDGEPDDNDIHVGWFAATRSDHFTTGPAPDVDAGAAPWNSFDAYSLNPAALVPKYETAHAYVTGGILVAQFGLLTLGGPDRFSQVNDVVLEARIVRGAGGFILDDITLAGRWPVGYMISGLASVTFGLTSCADPLPMNSVTQLILQKTCGNVDTLSAGDDNRSQYCDALSFGVKFGSRPATLSARVISTGLEQTCPPVTSAVCDELDLDGGFFDAGLPPGVPAQR